MLKTCTTCGGSFDPTYFVKDKSRAGGYSNRCKGCDRARRLCPEAKAKRNTRISDRRKVLKDKSIAYLGGKCKICGGVFHSSAFDFHHKKPDNKSFDISSRNNITWERRVAELDKCVLLCSNCHREFHYKYVGEACDNYDWG